MNKENVVDTHSKLVFSLKKGKEMLSFLITDEPALKYPFTEFQDATLQYFILSP